MLDPVSWFGFPGEMYLREATVIGLISILFCLTTTALGQTGTTAALTGPSTNLSRDEIESQPSVEGSLNEYASHDPRLVYIDPERGELSAAGRA